VRWDDLDGATEGLVCLAGGGGGRPLAAAVRGHDAGAVRDCVGRLKALFGKDLYLDLQRHLDPGEERFNRALLAVAGSTAFP